MLDLGMLNSEIDAFPGLNLTQVINLLPLFFLSTIRVGAFMLSSPFYCNCDAIYSLRMVVSAFVFMSTYITVNLHNYSSFNERRRNQIKYVIGFLLWPNKRG